MSMAFISHPDCLLHTMGDHPESPARLIAIEDELIRAGLYDLLTPYEAPLATKEQLLRVHDENYVEMVFQASPENGFIALDPDVLMGPYSLNAALRAAGAVVHGVALLMQQSAESVFCNVRPPGHHAEHDKAMGFCFFNNVAVGVAHAMSHFDLKRVAIIDFDVHHGNGTEDIFREDERVLYCSSFESPFYPFTGAETKSRHILNIPLPAGTNGQTFQENIDAFWLKQVRAFNPDMIFFSAGFDAYKDDPLADLLLTVEDYYLVTQKIKAIADECCSGRMISVLEGGYHLKGLGACAAAHIKGLLGQ